MKRFAFIAMAAAALLCSCQKEESLPKEENNAQELVFTATMEDSPASKVTLDGENIPEWEVGDVISIDGHAYTATTAGKKSTFEGTGATEGTHHAYFPASLYNGKFPAVQTYTAGKFDIPMYAESTTTSLAFKNLCAVMAIKVTSADIATLKSIKVASDKKINGSFTVKDNAAVIGEDGTNVVVLNFPEALNLTSEGTTFYIYIPAQEYKYFNIFLSADGATYTQAMATKKADGLGTIARSQKLNIDYAKNATKLWEGKLFFADCNVGAESEAEYGALYCWGGSVDQYTNADGIYKEGYGALLTGTDDTATALWGSNWRMPTKAEFSDEAGGLLRECYCKWAQYNGTDNNGLLCTGKGKYSSNSIFLRAAGNSKYWGLNTFGYYWSSTYVSDKDSFYLDFDKNGPNVRRYLRSVGLSVRAVLVEAE